MARREVVQYFDDIDGSALTEKEVNIVKFSLDGTNFVLDLSAKNAEKFRAALAPYVKVARKETAVAAAPRRTGSATPDSKKIREWGKANGYEVADRGKLPADLIDAYRSAESKR